MIFFFFGRPSALFRYQTILMAESFASEPELAKNTLLMGTGARCDQHLRQVDHRLVRLGGEGVVERQLAHLVRGGLHQAFVVEAERGAPQAGDGLDIFLAGLVPHAHALAAGDHHRPDLLMRLQVGVGMQHVGDVAGGGGIRAEWGAGPSESPPGCVLVG